MEMEKTALRPSLKRSLQDVEESNRAKLLRTAGSYSVLSRARFANGQLPQQQIAQLQNYSSQFPFPIAKASALVDDEFDSDSESSISDSDEDGEESDSAGGQTPQIKVETMSRTASVLTISSTQSGVPPTAEERMKLLLKAKLLSESAPSLGALLQAPKTDKPPPKLQNEQFQKPDDFLRDLLEKKSVDVKIVSVNDLPDFFVPLTDAIVDGYDMDLVKKVREEDVVGLRELWKGGRSMQVSNKFGDSIVHMACRRSSMPVLKFLLEEAQVSCKVCCDSGRTPLHDACWTSAPNFEVVNMLLEICPDLLYITDKRGFTPLNYARNSHWVGWCKFLEKWPHQKLIAKEIWGKS